MVVFRSGQPVVRSWMTGGMGQNVLGVTVDEVKTVREGETVSLLTGFTGLQSDVAILWFYGPVDPNTKIVQSIFHRGEIITDYSDKFRDRLQLDRQTGSLTIRNISTTDSGVYKVQIINGYVSEKRFSLTVYATVPAPHIRVRQSRSAGSGSSGPKCSVVCSVENGRDVTLSWYKGKEILNQTSSPDLSTILSLPLEIEDQDNNIYSCVADNPVSQQTTQLTKELCPHSNGKSDATLLFVNILCKIFMFVYCVAENPVNT
ncbi:hepatocyte cell adhesion molecule-like [Chanos chanos]|uniref:Hepatocyte cell adhesion molecule-like n=1 Tax=Chanos chanos TaxID=29144 RepID=A0A6J2WJ52_CHACN|nr:hepatocyte cell adhesion molecule-like [Chanos chanos]